MIEVTNKLKCTGCAACFNICPVDAITMHPDEEGFVYPNVDKSKCINCNKCEKVCPFVTKLEIATDYQKCFAAYNKNSEDRNISSSGGIFIALAKIIIAQGGVVFGSAYDDKFMAYHKFAENEEELKNLIGSKYMQSEIGLTYRMVKKFLEVERKVMFVGTSCQIGGLISYLHKDYSNLVTVDFICLGVPSPLVWSDYLNTFFSRKDITFINFKDKSLGWHTFSLRIDSKKNFVKSGRKTYFFSGYFRQLYSRPSCSDCIFKKGNRVSDITISDCWGYSKIAPEMDDNKGLSSIECHSDKGMKVWEEVKLQLEWKDADILDVFKYNENYCSSAKMAGNREQFWNDYNVLPKKDLFKKYCSPDKNIQNPIRFIRHFFKSKLIGDIFQ